MARITDKKQRKEQNKRIIARRKAGVEAQISEMGQKSVDPSEVTGFRSRSAADNRGKKKGRAGRTAGRLNLKNLSWSKLREQSVQLIDGFDYVLLAMIYIMCIFGVAMVFSAGSYSTIGQTFGVYRYFIKQLAWVVIGTGFLALFSNLDYHYYYKFGYILMAISIVLLVAVSFTPLGVEINGARRWLNLGLFRITPSELSKVFMIIFTSSYLTARPKAARDLKCLLFLFAVIGAHFILVVKQPNLSTAIVICAIVFGIMLTAGLSWWFLGAGVGAAALGTVVILTYFKDTHWYSRLTSWRDPFAFFQEEGYQVSQSLIALGNGGLKGLGFGNSISKNLYLPEPQNDFILAIIGEELGYIGILILMLAYIFMLYRLIRIAIKAKDALGFYLTTGVAVMLGLQVIINVAVVTASMPATGITLPFVSYGGTSIISFMTAMGIALNVSRSSSQNQLSGKVKQ